MPKILRRNSVFLRAGATYRKRTKTIWELDEEPERKAGILYYEDIRPRLHLADR